MDAEVTRQAVTLAYVQDFRLMMWIVLVTFPLIMLLKPVASTAQHNTALE
jgi:DHA2 family multidrug resistance protein